jgi:anti-sigma regulatory factor (Ser/Thr protein kinase)
MTLPYQTNVPVLRLELNGDLSQIAPAAVQVQEFLRSHGCAERLRSDCELVMVEACNNAIKHTQAHTNWEPVGVEVRVEAGQIEMRIIDHGPGFEWPKTAALPEPEEESGRGVFLIRALTDDAAYLREADKNVLVLRKKIVSPV